MKLLNRYLLSYFIRVLSLCTGAFVGIYLLIDFFEKVDDFIDYHARLTDYGVYLTCNIPSIVVQILPLAILTSVLLTLGGLSRTNEITAMRACGFSLWRIVQPLMGLALLASLVLLLLNEFVVPWSNKQLNTLLEVQLKGRQQPHPTRHEIWYRDGERIINIVLAQPREQKLEGITIFTFDQQQKIIARTHAARARFENENWRAGQVTIRRFDQDSGDLLETSILKDQILNLGRSGEDFFDSAELDNELNFRRLAALATKLEQEGYDSVHQRVDMHNRLAAPFTCLIMGFLGVPFALQKGRNINIALGLGSSLTIGITYFILQSLITAFGYSGALPPILAAWSTNIIFLLFGIWLMLNVRE